MGTASNINVSILQMGKIEAWRINCQKFWSGPSQTYGAEECDTGDVNAKSCSLLVYWVTSADQVGAAKNVLGQPFWDDSTSNPSGVWALWAPLKKTKNLILHYLKTTKKITKHINVHNKRISIFSLCIIFPATNMFLEARGNIYPKPQTCNH